MMNASSALLTKVEHLLRKAFNPIAGDGDRFRIVVADGNTVSLAAFDVILLGQRPPHAPAEEETLIVAGHTVLADHGTLRSGTGVQTQAGVIVAVAIFRKHVMADLPTDAVPV